MRTGASVLIPVPRILADAFVPYVVFVVGLSMLFGGGTRQGLWSDVMVQLPALPLLPWAIGRLTSLPLTGQARWAIVLLCAIVVLPLLQLIPLPPAVWATLPGHGPILTTYQTAGISAPWLPISLTPTVTWRGVLSLLPAVTIFLATLSLDPASRRRLVLLVLMVAFVSVPIDMLQMLGGPQSGLRFFTITNDDRAVGFFANANHHAALLYCAIPLACALALGLARDEQQGRRYGGLMAAFFFVAVVIGISLTLSRAGLVLALAAGVSCLALIWRQSRDGRSMRPLFYAGGAILVALLIAFQFGFVGIMRKTEASNIMSDLRWPVAAVTWHAARDFVPFGSGLGSFVPVYEMYAPQALVRAQYVNHAHDDWLELWLTGGVAALAIAFCYLVWFASAAGSAWWRDHQGGSLRDMAVVRAGSIVMVLLMLHSLVDYPLRTIALSVLFALCAAMLVPFPYAPPEHRSAAPGDRERIAHRRASGNRLSAKVKPSSSTV